MKLGLIRGLPFVIAFAVATSACTPMLSTPATFAAVKKGDYDYRATTAQGVVIAARKEGNKPEASLDFWARAIDLRLKRDGYTAEGESAIKSDRGLDGRALRYTRDQNGRTMRYWLTVYATDSNVYLVEAGGDKEDFDPALPQIERAIRSLKD